MLSKQKVDDGLCVSLRGMSRYDYRQQGPFHM